MSQILSIDDEAISISFPEEKFKSILQKLDIHFEEDLKVSDVKRIFLSSIGEFKRGALALDEMSEIAERLWFGLEDKNTKLADVLHMCAELNFYIRRILELGRHGNFVVFMVEVIKYHNRYKSKI